MVFPAWLIRASRWNVAIALYAVVSVVAVAGALFAPGTLGHHWDWIVPSDPAELRQLAYGQASAWQNYDFGSFVTFRYATILTGLLFGLPGFLGLGGAFVSKSLILLNVFVSALSMRFLLLTLTRDGDNPRDGIAATFGGFLYALAPYAYNQVISGDQSALISDALSPLAIALSLRCVRANGRHWIAYALGAALTFTASLASVQVFAFSMVIAWIVCFVAAHSVRAVVRLIALTVATVALCSYWLVPVVGGGHAVQSIADVSPITDALAVFAQFSNPWLTLTMLAFPGEFYQHAIAQAAPLFFLAYGVLLALVVTALVRRPSAMGIVLAVLFVLTALVPLGGNPIVGPFIILAFKALLPYSLFLRTPQHLMFVGTLVVPILVYLAARSFAWRVPAVWVAIGAAIVLCYGQGFFLHSNFFGLIGPFEESKGEAATVAMAQEPANQEFRTMYVPVAPGYYYHPGIFDYYFEASDEPQIRFLPSMTMGFGVKWTPYEPTQQLLQALDELIPDGGTPAQQRMLLQMAAVKNMVVHSIGVPYAGLRLYGQNRRPYLEDEMRRNNVAKVQASFDDRSLWQVGAPVAQAYAPDCVLYAPARAGIYEILALSAATASCARPAVIASTDSQTWSETILPAFTFVSWPSSIPFRLIHSNLHLAGSSIAGYSGTVASGAGETETFALPRVPTRATGFGLRIYSNLPRFVHVQVYAPDERNVFQANVDVGATPLDALLDFKSFRKIGNPEWKNAAAVQFSSTNIRTQAIDSYFGGMHWTYARGPSVSPDYFRPTGNRFDQVYYGHDRPRVLFVPAAEPSPVFATVRLQRAGNYDVSALVQDVGRSLALQVTLDGRAASCVGSRVRSNESLRVVQLAQAPLRAGAHVLSVRFCGRFAREPGVQGVESLVIAAARLQPPARRVTGDAEITDDPPGQMRIRTSAGFLVWTDSFDPRWEATQGGIALEHLMVNGYANGWRLRAGAGDVVLTFGPQRSLDAGIALSLAFALCALGGILATTIPRRRRKARIEGSVVESPARE
jgi:hypothetical protein